MKAQRVTQPVTHGRVTPDSAMGHAAATSVIVWFGTGSQINDKNDPRTRRITGPGAEVSNTPPPGDQIAIR